MEQVPTNPLKYLEKQEATAHPTNLNQYLLLLCSQIRDVLLIACLFLILFLNVAQVRGQGNWLSLLKAP